MRPELARARQLYEQDVPQIAEDVIPPSTRPPSTRPEGLTIARYFGLITPPPGSRAAPD